VVAKQQAFITQSSQAVPVAVEDVSMLDDTDD
jgi:hypothetical protein